MNKENEYDFDLIINSLSRGGAERVCITLANELYKRGYSIRIITLRFVKNNYLSDINENICVECLNAKKDIFGLIKLFKIIKTKKFKKIIAFDERITSIFNFSKIIYKSNYKVITRVINNIDIQEKMNKKIIYKFIYKFSKKFFKYSDLFIFQCYDMKERMIKYFNLKNDNNNIVIYNPLSPLFNNIKIENNKSDYFLMVGRLDLQKGYNYLIDTIKLCNEKKINIKVKILGDGIEKNNIIEKLKKCNIDSIEILGNKKNVYDYYRRAKGLILTSVYEGFPNVLIEATACGCPIISFDCPTGPSEIINKTNGILVEYLNIEKLAQQLINFDKIKWDYKKISNDTLKKYNKDIIVEKYIEEVIKI